MPTFSLATITSSLPVGYSQRSLAPATLTLGILKWIGVFSNTATSPEGRGYTRIRLVGGAMWAWLLCYRGNVVAVYTGDDRGPGVEVGVDSDDIRGRGRLRGFE